MTEQGLSVAEEWWAKAASYARGQSFGPRAHGAPESEYRAVEELVQRINEIGEEAARQEFERIGVFRQPLIMNAEEHEQNRWGVCPFCGMNDGYINIGKGHWFFCKRHRVKWLIGSNLHSTWREQTEAEQRRTYDELGFAAYARIDCSDAEPPDVPRPDDIPPNVLPYVEELEQEVLKRLEAKRRLEIKR